MERNPPHVKKKIRQEDGFLCAHPECDDPFLYYHHFDPPWAELNHNNPEGIIALCGKHVNKADGGAYTKEQLREWKDNAPSKNQKIQSKIEWLRKDIVAQVGGQSFSKNIWDIRLFGKPLLWFRKDKETGYRLMNLDLPSISGQSLIRMTNNDWELYVKPRDLICGPYGKKITIQFFSGEFFEIEFRDVPANSTFISFDHTVYKIRMLLPSHGIAFDNKEIKIGNVNINAKNSLITGSMVAYELFPPKNPVDVGPIYLGDIDL